MAHFDRFSLIGGKHVNKPLKEGEILSVVVRDEAEKTRMPITRYFIKKPKLQVVVEKDLRNAVLNARTIGMFSAETKPLIEIRKFTFFRLKRQSP